MMAGAGETGTVAPELALARPLLPPSIALAATDPRSTRHRPLPEEAEGLTRFAPKRAREFAAGRAAAHRAMRQLGEPARPVRSGDDRAPIWPDGLTGSISHCSTACIAAVARKDEVRSIGVDVEEDKPLWPEVIPTVCTITERAWLATLPEEDAGRMARLIFSAKECAYKCQYPLSHALFGFEMFEITLDLDTGQFEATFTADAPPFRRGEYLCGRFSIGHGLIVTAMTVQA